MDDEIQWVQRDIDEKLLDILLENGIPSILAKYLIARNIDLSNLESFFKPLLRELSDPFLFPGLKNSAERIWNAVQNNERILIHGDYDVDGITSSALLYSVLNANGADVSTFIPNRFDDGYGFSLETLNRCSGFLSEKDGGLIITVDCGICSFDTVTAANKLGIDVIITDHHDPSPDKIPDAYEVIDPKIHPDKKDIMMLSGVGVAFKLCHAFLKLGRIRNYGGFKTELKSFLDIVSLGTIADIVPLHGENRIIVKHGIKIIKNQTNPGIRALVEKADLRGELKATDIAFKIAPRINAAGRMGNAMDAYNLLIADNIVDAHNLAEKLEKYNIQRRKIEKIIFEKAEAIIEKRRKENESSYINIVWGEKWHMGVLGIVASRLVQKYNRPALVLSSENGILQGSGRSIPDFNILDVLSENNCFLKRYGGHPMAVGLALQKDNLLEFISAVEKSCRKKLKKELLQKKYFYDATAEMKELNSELFSILAKLKPFGHGNSEPVFRIKNLELYKYRSVGNGHTKGCLKDFHGNLLDFIAFGINESSLPCSAGGVVDVLAIPQINHFRGRSDPQLQVLDIRLS